MILCGGSDSRKLKYFNYLYWTISKILVSNRFNCKEHTSLVGSGGFSKQEFSHCGLRGEILGGLGSVICSAGTACVWTAACLACYSRRAAFLARRNPPTGRLRHARNWLWIDLDKAGQRARSFGDSSPWLQALAAYSASSHYPRSQWHTSAGE